MRRSDNTNKLNKIEKCIFNNRPAHPAPQPHPTTTATITTATTTGQYINI